MVHRSTVFRSAAGPTCVTISRSADGLCTAEVAAPERSEVCASVSGRRLHSDGQTVQPAWDANVMVPDTLHGELVHALVSGSRFTQIGLDHAMEIWSRMRPT